MRLQTIFVIVVVSTSNCAVQKRKESDENKAESFSYQFEVNGCNTGRQTFQTLEAYCAGLTDEKLNQGCASLDRAKLYNARCSNSQPTGPSRDENSPQSTPPSSGTGNNLKFYGYAACVRSFRSDSPGSYRVATYCTDIVSGNNAYVQDETTKLLQGKCPTTFSVTNNIGTACTFKPRWTSGTVSTEKSAVDEGRKKDCFSEKLAPAATYGDITCP